MAIASKDGVEPSKLALAQKGTNIAYNVLVQTEWWVTFRIRVVN